MGKPGDVVDDFSAFAKGRDVQSKMAYETWPQEIQDELFACVDAILDKRAHGTGESLSVWLRKRHGNLPGSSPGPSGP